MPVSFRFDAKNERAQRAAQKHAARMVTDITKRTRDGIRSIVVRSIREGIPPYDAARMIRSIVGLTNSQAQSVANYRRGLIDRGLTLQRVNTLTDRYADRRLLERSRSIARTEIMDALNAGKLEAWRQARRDGLLDKHSTKEVLVHPDCCESICEPLSGEERPIDKPFSTGDMSPPFHPRCRCTMVVNP